jgi:hypothetical protein
LQQAQQKLLKEVIMPTWSVQEENWGALLQWSTMSQITNVCFRGRRVMVVIVFKTAYAISAYHY